jgi:hypothetical protein
MRVTSYNLKPIVKGSGPYHEMRWNVEICIGKWPQRTVDCVVSKVITPKDILKDMG